VDLHLQADGSKVHMYLSDTHSLTHSPAALLACCSVTEVHMYLSDTHSLTAPLPSSPAAASRSNRCGRSRHAAAGRQFMPKRDVQKRDSGI